MRTFFLLSCMASGFLLACVTGCDDGRPACVPVSGQVLIDKKPLKTGFIRFIPQDARAATGTIDADGHFTLKTFEDGDGVVPGTHPVAITAMEQLGGRKQRWHAPKKYVNPRESGLTATVSGSTDSLEINISWEGGQPFVETLK